MTAGAARTLLAQKVLPGKRVLLAGTGPLQLVLSAELARAGAEVVMVLEGAHVFRNGVRHMMALWGQWERLTEGLRSRLTLLGQRIPYHTGRGVIAASGTARAGASDHRPSGRSLAPHPRQRRDVSL